MPGEEAFRVGPCRVSVKRMPGDRSGRPPFWRAVVADKGAAHVWSGRGHRDSPELRAAIEAAIEEKGIEPKPRADSETKALRRIIVARIEKMDAPELAALYASLLGGTP